ncbi:MAG: hypothetical protein K2Q13_01325 [Nitrosomonas sp.]|uniref:hypothetical protein n=1 Tax=Nitrosomonas sp. TaxID=42353 RepID=UPI0025F24ED6|nr:hypothetical protein [Nitrosomonas sp.]MBY0473684.1 hypothetical protein [Nitrosomonas sp.]
MTMLKRRVIALEARVTKEATIEDLLHAIADEKNGIMVSEKDWQQIRKSRAYKFIESIKPR